jgi:hypothetical protein
MPCCPRLTGWHLPVFVFQSFPSPVPCRPRLIECNLPGFVFQSFQYPRWTTFHLELSGFEATVTQILHHHYL